MKLTKRELWLMEFAFDQGFNSSGTFNTFMQKNPTSLDLMDDIPEPEPTELGNDRESWKQAYLLMGHLLPPEWRKLVAAFADGAEVQQDAGDGWYTQSQLTLAKDRSCYRIKPRTITVNGFEIPAGETKEPDEDQVYYVPSVSKADYYVEDSWDGTQAELRLFKRGLVYLKREDAIKRAKAMLGVDPDEST